MEFCFLKSLHAISIELTPSLIIHDTAQAHIVEIEVPLVEDVENQNRSLHLVPSYLQSS